MTDNNPPCLEHLWVTKVEPGEQRHGKLRWFPIHASEGWDPTTPEVEPSFVFCAVCLMEAPLGGNESGE